MVTVSVLISIYNLVLLSYNFAVGDLVLVALNLVALVVSLWALNKQITGAAKR